MTLETLKKIYLRLCKEYQQISVAEFCRNWLGVERSYMAVLSVKERNPSLKVMLTCSSRIRKLGDVLSARDYPKVAAKGRRLTRLAEDCLDQAWGAVR